jgi:multidrug efflux pump subunit AcrB
MMYRFVPLVLAISVLVPAVGGCAADAPQPKASPPAAQEPLAMIVVEAVYPGANASVVGDTVAAPIEQQVAGIAKSLHLVSRSTGDGRCTLQVLFPANVDLDRAQREVQRRVGLALAVLPDIVKRHGVSVRKKAASLPLIVCLSSPGGRFDTVYLGNYARVQLRDELARVPGVGEIISVGPRAYGLRIWLDPGKLAALGLKSADVVKALRGQNIPVEADTAKDSSIAVNTLGRLVGPEQVGDIPLKTDRTRQDVHLKEVARLELESRDAPGYARLDGTPVVALCLYPSEKVRPGAWSADVRKRLGQLCSRLPEGLRLDIAFDFTANEEARNLSTVPQYLVLDVDLPDGASVERTLAVVQTCQKALAKMAGVQQTLALCGPPFAFLSNQASILVRLAPVDKRDTSREQARAAIRARLTKEVADAEIRLRDLTGPSWQPLGSYPVDFGLCGPEAASVRPFARKLAERLAKSGKLTDTWTGRQTFPRARLVLDINRAQLKGRGVAAADVMNTLQTYLGGAALNDFNRFGRTWQVVLSAERKQADDLKQLKVRNNKGEMVALSAVMTIRGVEGPEVVEHLDGMAMVSITANPAAGVSLAEARALCERLAEQVRRELSLSAEYRLTWLGQARASP